MTSIFPEVSEMGKMEKMYNYLFVEHSVSLSREWPLISSPLPLTLIIIGYLFFVLYAGPRYMKNRPPYELRTFMLLYNSIQILTNLWMVQEHLSFGWFSEYGVTCATTLALNSPKALKIFNNIWWLMLLKIFDLVETCTFVLRKKDNQVSFLHVYHHATNILFVWIYLKYILDARATLISLINCTVHVIMYMYYFISARGPKYQRIMSPLKPFITRIQMVQFLAIIIYMIQFANPICSLDGQICYTIGTIFGVNILINLALFYNFYKKSYTNVSKGKKS
ncbi:elongation of very long chain fatty acids protein 1-like [Nylanderia fulva]|uniref:elongation of very long chain fatty acids protein 1-like n=1 Tax=Nylanderia fulva TaxID=613905 RepID=UPI0010FB455B|nr:elongation of very long chain fatty acids protein 1-like [Nylanderia fulva]